MSKSREQISKNQLRDEDLLKPPFGRESTCRTRGEDCSTPKFSLPILLHRRTVYDAYSAPRAFPHPSCSQLGCCVPTMPKPCCCPSTATHKMCRQVCGQGASAAAAQPQCPARPLPRRRVLHYWWRRLTRSNKKARSKKAPMSKKHIFMSGAARGGASRSV